MTRCQTCDAPAPQDARFCPSCGTELTAAHADPDATSQVRKTVTVLFCDLTDSTALSERLDPEPLRTLMLRYYALARDCLERYGGSVEKFIGDAVVAVFGVPTLHEDDALRAVRAAADLLATIERSNDELARMVGATLGVRIGVNTGEVVAYGEAAPGQSLTSGEPVNVAARLQQHAGVGQVLLGEKTWRLVAGAVLAEPVGPLSVKGKSEPITAYRLLDFQPEPAAAVRPSDVPLVGREHELRQFELVLDRLDQNPCCHVVTVLGEAGLGKSRLAREYIVLAERRGALIGMGRCVPYGRGASLHALAEALRQVIGPQDPRDLVSTSPRDRDFVEALAVIRGGLLRDGSPGARSDQLGWALNLVLGRLARDHPVVLVLDDLQWAKPALLDMLDLIADWASDSAVVLTCVARSDLIEQRPGWGSGRLNITTLGLSPLGPESSRLLAASFCETMAHDIGVLDSLAERAAGNPFHLEQLVAMAEEGTPYGLPPTVEALISARMDRLEPAARGLLQCAATIGRGFTRRDVEVLLGADTQHAQHLRILSRRRFVEVTGHEPDGDTYRFVNTLIQEVAYRSTSKRLRAQRHRLLADHLEQAGEPAERFGDHRERGVRLLAELGPLDEESGLLRLRAAADLGTAGIRVLHRGDLPHAADLLARSLALAGPEQPTQLWFAEQLAEIRLLLGDAATSTELLRELLPQAVSAGDRAVEGHVRLLLAFLDSQDGGPHVAETVAARMLPVFEATGDDLGMARACLWIGQAQQSRGLFAATDDLFRRALRHAVAADAELELASVLGAMAMSWWLGPEPVDVAIRRCEELLAKHVNGRRAVRVAITCPLAALHAARGDFATAERLVADARSIVGELQHAYAAVSVMIFAARVNGLAGRWDTAVGLLEQARDACARQGDQASYGVAGLDLARALLWQARPEQAAGHLTDTDLDGPLSVAAVAGMRARVLAASGRHEQARAQARRAVEESLRTDSSECQGIALLDQAYVATEAADLPAAGELARQARDRFADKGHTVGMGWADALLSGGAAG